MEADLDGHEVFNVAAPTSLMREPTTDLLRRYGLEPRRLANGLSGNWSAMDSAKAARVLGYRAEHQWQQYVGGAGGDPDEGVHRGVRATAPLAVPTAGREPPSEGLANR